MLINLMTLLTGAALASAVALMLVRAQGRPVAAWVACAAVWALVGVWVVLARREEVRRWRRDGLKPPPSDLRYYLMPICAMAALSLAIAAAQVLLG